jgi:hypothetical protein
MSDETSGKSIVPSRQTDLMASGTGGNRLIRRAASDALLLMQTVGKQQKPKLHQARTKKLFFPRISIRGNRFRLVDDGTETVLETAKLDVVIVGMNPKMSKTFYAKAWNPEAEPTVPDCYSLDGIKPHPESESPQNDLCASCSHNAWGSKIGSQGQPLKACKDQKRLAIVAADDPDGRVYLLQVTPAALLGLNAYQKELSMRGIPLEIVKTRIVFDTVANFPKLKFGFGGFLDDDTYASVKPMFGREDVLAITGASQSNPTITKLDVSSNQLSELDLSSALALTHLECNDNQLTELDLSSVPALTHLWCYNNQLTELDLSSVPALTHLRCYNNQLTDLDLSSVPAMTFLWCSNNQLTEIDLSSVPAMTRLYCDDNQLTELDLSSVPALTLLWCDNNQLTELDLSFVPSLSHLSCCDNQLTELDIRSCLNLKDVTVDPWVIVHKRPDQTVRRRGSW